MQIQIVTLMAVLSQDQRSEICGYIRTPRSTAPNNDVH